MEMLNQLVETKQLALRTVLMDSWYAAQKLMSHIDGLGTIYYCPLKTNRLVDDSGGIEKYKRIDQMDWSETQQRQGKLVKLRGFPKDKKVKLFRVTVSTGRTDYVATNDLSPASSDIVQQAAVTSATSPSHCPSFMLASPAVPQPNTTPTLQDFVEM